MSPSPSVWDKVYAAPEALAPFEATAHAARLDAARSRKRGGAFLGAATLFFALGLGLGVLAESGEVAAGFFFVSALLALVGAVFGLTGLVQGASGRAGVLAALSAIGLALVSLGMTGVGALAAFLSTMSFTRGRQLRRFGKIYLPPVAPGEAWTTTASSMASIDLGRQAIADAATRLAVAAQWRENGRTEHASVAAFARLTLDLMALGAPPELVADANRDALDEIRHAQLCFGLARALDGRSESPAAFPAAAQARTLSRIRPLALAQLAVDSLVDGALHEGISARIIAKLARRCEVSVITGLLKEIAADEGRHARHGWDVALWCLAEGGEPVASALEGALRALPAVMTSPLPSEARDGRWERFGIMGEALETEEHDAAREHVERRAAQAIAASRAARQPAVGYGNASVG